VETKGLSCHGSAPERGVNAVYKMAPIIAGVEEMGAGFTTDPFLGQGTVTISQIRSTSPSLCAVADSCTIHLDRRLTFGETEASAVAELAALPGVRQAEAAVRVLEYAAPTHTGLVYPTRKVYPAWVTPVEHPSVQAGAAVFEGIFGTVPEVGRWIFSTNGVATAGMFDIPTIGFGPANEQYAHSPEDQIPVKHLEAAVVFYTAFPSLYSKK
jgi:putative selenium metabolism hydrolase